MNILDQLWRALGNPYRERRVIIIRDVRAHCCFIVINMYYFVFVGVDVNVDSIILNMYYFVYVDVNVYFDGVIKCNNVWLGKDVPWKVRFVQVGRKEGVLKVRLLVVITVREMFRVGAKVFKSR